MQKSELTLEEVLNALKPLTRIMIYIEDLILFQGFIEDLPFRILNSSRNDKVSLSLRSPYIAIEILQE